MTAPGAHPVGAHGGASATCMVNRVGWIRVDSGRDLRCGHRLGHREPGLAGDQWFGRRDGGGEHRSVASSSAPI